jgi:type II secretion system protein G
VPLRDRHFVRLVVGEEKMTFEGQETTWENLPPLLRAVADRPHTVLEIAIASDQMSVRDRDRAQNRASQLARSLGFEYPSDIGVHPLGSTGTDSQRVAGKPGDSAEDDQQRAPQLQLQSQAMAQLKNLQLALRLYRMDLGYYPSTNHGLQALSELPGDLPDDRRWRGPYLRGDVPLDPWGSPYRYHLLEEGPGDKFDLWSIGPDRVDGTADDIGK